MHKQIMRWFGNGDPMYQDGNEDPAQRMQGAAIGFGALMATSVDNVAGAARGMSGAIGNASQGVAGKVNEKRGYEQGIISGGASDIKDGNMTQSRFDGYSAQQKSSMLNEAGVSSEAEAKAKFGFK